MSNPDQAAQRVSDLINDAEQAMDVAMAKASLLVSELPALQTAAGLNASWAQPAVVSICSALTDLTSARGSIITAHKALSTIQRRLGLAVMETPTNGKEGDSKPFAAQGSDTDRVVALRA